MNRTLLHGRRERAKLPKPAKTLIIIVTVITGIVLTDALFTAYLDRHPWMYGGAGAPDVIYLNGEYRLERVIAFRGNCHVMDIRDGKVIYTIDERSGAVDLDGNVVVPISGGLLKFDESGQAAETYEHYTSSDTADKPYKTLTAGGTDKGTYSYYDLCGLKVVKREESSGSELGVPDPVTGEVNTLFGGNGTDAAERSDSRWRLEQPRIYGDLIAVRIYYSDCVYRAVRQERS